MSEVDGDLVFHIKQDDTQPPIQIQLFDPMGQPLDVTGAVIKFYMRRNGQALKVNGTAIAPDPATGVVQYDWQAGDTNEVGTYRAEFELNGNDTYPKETWITVFVVADLN